MTTVNEVVSNSSENELSHLKDKKNIEKSTLRRIEISELPKKLPDFKNSTLTKDNALAQWMQEWISNGLKEGKLQKNDLLPKKADLANFFGVSIGTVQNAIRYIEDNGYVESKQRIGTLIKDSQDTSTQLRKQTSKRDQAIVSLKKLIIDNKYAIDEPLPSSRELSKMIGSASNTTRLALEYLASIGVIESKGCRGNKANWILRKMPELTEAEISKDIETLSTDTLVNQVERDLKEYINLNCKVGDKLPPHFELSNILKVSIKTVHDAMRRLIDQGILRSKRGRYGTTIMRLPSESSLQPKQENSIFASAAEASFYNYEKVEKHIKHLIRKNYKVGDKLPAMGKLAQELDVSSNTIRKALQRLSENNIVEFSRGRYGGTFVTKLPEESETSTFTWLSINPEHVAAYKKSPVTN